MFLTMRLATLLPCRTQRAEQPGPLCSLWGLPPRSGPSLTSDLRGITRTLWGGRVEGMLERGLTHTTIGVCREPLDNSLPPLHLQQGG